MRRIDVQGRLRSVLASALPGVEVRVRVPDPRPAALAPDHDERGNWHPMLGGDRGGGL